ncbi:uncharacterized protein LOC115875047 isoform X2 [Sitophilus oryzae]|uniref:Uncharacterized protein LOC115875047 isoform X2 n=1 Tax=Sitophilus oryzae TaxID=7048 RepID=A0A6J2X4Y7_SITOR|nr:uncharacterized protein LOC115875047 isoform X2 [Sitophilus oryzae]
MEDKSRLSVQNILLFFCLFGFLSLSFITCFNTMRLHRLEKEVKDLKETMAVMTMDYSRISPPRTKRDIESTEDVENLNVHKPLIFDNKSYPLNNPDRIPNHSVTLKPSVQVSTSKVHFDHYVKRSFFKSGDSGMYDSSENTAGPDYTVLNDGYAGTRKRNRQRLETLDEKHPRTGRIKPLPTIHFSGDTSRYVYGTHENFNGNGHLRHLQRTFIDWKANNWVEKTGMSSHFNLENGHLTIREPGIYFIYAQIYYLDEHDQIGYRVYKNDDTILQCTVFSNTSRRTMKGNTCYTAGAEYLAENDKISLGDLSDGRYSLFEPGKSFFGVIKLGDVRARV